MGIWDIDAARVARVRGKPLEEAVRLWDRSPDEDLLLEAARQIAEVTSERFPVGAWPEMTLGQYALGTEVENSFCKVMEFRTPALGGIGGGAAKKHLIYRKSDGSWYHRPEYANEREAWEAVRAGFIEGFELASDGRWDDLDEIPAIKPAASLRGKTFFTYYSSDLIPIYATGFQEYFYRLLGGKGSAPNGVGGARALYTLAHATGHFEGWHPIEIARLLRSWSDPRVAKRIVKIAPGNDAEFWEACRQGGYICVGWDDVGDLKRFESQEEFRLAFGQAYPDYSPSKATLKANELWSLMELQPGDVVIANEGTSRIVGIGEVVEPAYSWMPDRPGPWAYHTVAIDWQDREPWRIDPIKKWALTTVSDISAEEYKRILQGVAGPGTTPAPPPEVAIPPSELFGEIATTIERKKQIVLYGPPGTGKTYNALRFGVWWLSERSGFDEASTLLGDDAVFTRADARLTEVGEDGVGLITRVTFHPSYTYEDFVEGYKPVPTETGQLDLRLTDGVFKRVCRAADANSSQTYLLLIDEINRGNIPKIFGELITLLESDKRDVKVVLPQSREQFSVPKNLYVLGTMNTADRSIKLLDAALRRRFAFIELMPDPAKVAGKVGGLDLQLFLSGLNSKIAATEGREKQIGHSFLLDGHGQPFTTPEDFAQSFKYEILPLLQEYAYEDYAELESYLGPKLVDAKEQTLNAEILGNPQDLVDALRAWFQPERDVADPSTVALEEGAVPDVSIPVEGEPE